MKTTFAELKEEHGPLLTKVASVLTQAADQLDSQEAIAKKASVEPGIDRARVQGMCENLVALNLAKKANIENAVNTVVADPTSMLSIIEAMTQTIAKSAGTERPMSPASLVPVGNLTSRKKDQSSSEAFQQLEASLESTRP